MNPLQQIGNFGQSVWLDFISRKAIADGTLQGLIDQGVVGMTSNPAIFEKAMNSSDYDAEIATLASAHSAEEIYQALAIEDVQAAADLLLPVYEKSGHTDGFVSLEVSPLLSQDTNGTIAEAKAFWARLGRPNVMIKIPATLEGLPAIEEALAAGLSINVTLLFSVERYKAVAERYIAGLERLAAAGGDVTKTRSVASFFLSRIDTMVDAQLKAIGTADAKALEGKAAIASAKDAYVAYEEIFGTGRWKALAALGAHPQRLLWASTSTKNPAYKSTMYVEPLIGPMTVNTMPLETIEAYLKDGHPSDQIKSGVAELPETFAALAKVGINLADVALKLEAEGLQKFVDPFHKLIAGVEAKRAAATTHKATV